MCLWSVGAKKQQMQFAEPSDTLFRTSVPRRGRGASTRRSVLASMRAKSPNRWESRLLRAIMCSRRTSRIFGRSAEIYSGHQQVHLLAVQFVAVPQNRPCMHVPTELGASLLRSHGYKSKLHVISNGYEARFTAKTQRDAGKFAPVPFHIVASGRLTKRKESCRINSCDRPLQACARY